MESRRRKGEARVFLSQHPRPPSLPAPCQAASPVIAVAFTWVQLPRERLAVIPASGSGDPGPGIW